MRSVATTTGTRCQPRYPTYLMASLESGMVFGAGTVLNVSDGGLFVATDLGIHVGTRLTVTFRVPEFGRLRAAALVVHRGVHQERRGLGVRFLNPSAAEPAVTAVRRWHEEYCWS